MKVHKDVRDFAVRKLFRCGGLEFLIFERNGLDPVPGRLLIQLENTGHIAFREVAFPAHDRQGHAVRVRVFGVPAGGQEKCRGERGQYGEISFFHFEILNCIYFYVWTICWIL